VLSIRIQNQLIEVGNFRYDSVTSEFNSEISVPPGFSIAVKTPLKLDQKFENRKFSVYFLHKKNLLESEIVQIFDKRRETRIGWCIPINALDSVEHDYADDMHFLRYAYVGIYGALNKLDSSVFLPEAKFAPPSIDFSEIFDESTALLIISDETLTEEFVIDKWLPSLAKHGYFELSDIDPKKTCIEKPRIIEKKLSLSPISEDLESENYLNNIYRRNLAYEPNTTLRFFYLYQVFELLIEYVFQNEQKNAIDLIIQSRKDTNATKEILEKASQNSSEKRRLHLLTANYCKGCTSEKDLIERCNELLIILGRDEGKELNTTLYPVRNFLFHQFRNFPSAAEQQLASVNDAMKTCVSELLAAYKPVEITV